MERYNQLLNSFALFYGLNTEQISKILSLAKITSYQPMDIIINEGDAAQNIYIITAGEVDVFKNDANGQNQYLLIHLNKGAIIGEMSLLNDLPRAATVRALSPTKTLELPISALHALAESDLADNKFIYYKIVENIARESSVRLRNMDQLIANLLNKEKMKEDVTASKMNFFMECWRF